MFWKHFVELFGYVWMFLAYLNLFESNVGKAWERSKSILSPSLLKAQIISCKAEMQKRIIYHFS